MNRKVKIASLIWYKFLPAHFGGQKVIDSFNNFLSAEFDFTAICSNKNIIEPNLSYTILPILPSSPIQIINPFIWIKLLFVLKKTNISHLILEHPYHVITAQLAKWFLKIKLIYHVHNIEYVRFKSLNKSYSFFIKFLEKWMFNISALNIFLTKEDMEFALSNKYIKSEASFLLPYFLKEKDVSNKHLIQQKIKHELNISNECKILFFNGTLDYQPNAEAIENIFEEIVPELNKTEFDFKIIISGRIKNEKSQYLKKYFNQQIIYVGCIKNVEDYYLAADIYINPVLTGFGIQTKTLEALSYNLPVVSFKNVLNGIEIDLCKEKLLVAPNWHSFNLKIKEASKYSEPLAESFFSFYNANSYSTSLKKRIESL